jgi:hypothetical protein
MQKEYFSHDYGTRNKKKLAALISKEKSRGYGLFWIIVEMLHEDSLKWMELDEITYLAIEKESGEDVEFVRPFIQRCIDMYKVFMQEGNRFTTERVLRNIDKRLEIRDKRSNAGKASAAKRQQNSTHVEQTPTSVEQNPTKERKRKESKVKKNTEIGADAPSFKKWDEKFFYDEIAKFASIFPKPMLRAFFDYWREKSPSGMMKFQLEATWNTKLRLERWHRSQKGPNGSNGSHAPPGPEHTGPSPIEMKSKAILAESNGPTKPQ